MKHYVDNVLKDNGIPVVGASVTVRVANSTPGTGALATLYSDDGVTTTSNPVSTNGQGQFDFYVADGRYDLTFSGTGITGKTIADIEITDVTESSTGDGGWAVKKLNEIRYADKYAGADAGAKINAAIADLPLTGGIVRAEAFQGAQTISSAITVDRPVVLFLGAANFTCSSTAVFNVSNPNLQVMGQGRGSSTVTSNTNAALFQFSGSTAVNFSFMLKGIKFAGGGGGYTNQLMSVPNQTAYQGLWKISDCYIGDFGTTATNAAVYFGDSNYRLQIRDCFFNNNRGGDLFIGYASDGMVDACQFGNMSTTKPHIRIIGGGDFRVQNSEFENNASSTIPDIILDAQTITQGGEIWITNNKFGGEGETAGTRYKIDATSATSTDYPLRDVFIMGNRFTGLSGSQPMKMIRITNPPYKWQVKNNIFTYASTVIDDVVAPTSATYGQCQFVGNEINPPTLPSGVIGTLLFTNDGRGFSVIRDNYGQGIDDNVATYQIRQTETPELRNRVPYSEAFGSWSLNNGATVTAGQTDPYGTTRACLINAGGLSFCGIGLALNVTSLPTRGVVKFWAKANTLSSITVLVNDNVNGNDVSNLYTQKLTSVWKQYKFPITYTNAAHAQNIFIYPGGQNGTTAGSVYLFGVQVSDFDSDYYPTTGAAASTTSYGSRLERGLILGESSGVSLQATGASGETWVKGYNTELLTLSTVGTTTDTVGNLLPANSIIESVVVRLTTTIATATAWSIGDSTNATRFTSSSSTLAAGTTAVGLNQFNAGAANQSAAAKVRVTTTGTPTAGAIRITVFYRTFSAPTS